MEAAVKQGIAETGVIGEHEILGVEASSYDPVELAIKIRSSGIADSLLATVKTKNVSISYKGEVRLLIAILDV